MPKQVYKLERFDGGINNSANPRDISDNEVESIKNGSVDSLGKIESLQYTSSTDNTLSGGSITSSSGDRATISEDDMVFGTGLFLFSSDYTGGELVTRGTHTGSNSSAFLLDSTNRFVDDIVNGADLWNLTTNKYTTITDTVDDSAGKIVGALSDSATWSTDDEYQIYNLSEATTPGQSTGDTYLCMPSNDSTTGGIYIKSMNNGNTAQANIKFGSNSYIRPVYYSADGVLRVSDGSFVETNNRNKWYGYIDRTLAVGDVSLETSIKTWISEDSEPKKLTSYDFTVGSAISAAPSSKTFGDNISTTTTHGDTAYTSNSNTVDTVDGDTDTEKTQTALAASSGMTGDYVNRVAVKIVTTGFSTGDTWTLTGVFRIGQTSGNAFASSGYKYKTFTLSHTKTIDNNEDPVVYDQANLSFSFGATEFPINSANARYSLRRLSVSGSGYGTVKIDSITFYGGGTGDETFSSTNNSIGLAIGDSTTTADEWAGDWNVGATFVYDENQESLVHQLLADTKSVITLTKAPYVNVSAAWNRKWNQRITGINIYMKKESDADWLLHGMVDLKSNTIRRPGDTSKITASWNTNNSAHLYKLDGETAKELPIIEIPPPDITRMEFDMKDQLVRQTIMTTQEDVKEIKEQLEKLNDKIDRMR